MSQVTNSPGSPSTRPVDGSKMLVISFSLAFLAVIVVLFYVQSIRNQGREQSMTLYTLNRSFEPGDVFDAERDVSAFQVPISLRPNLNHLSPVIDNEMLRGQNRRVVQRPVPANALLTLQLFREFDVGVGGGSPPAGRRNVNIRITGDEVPEVIRPGMTVDIIGSFPPSGGAAMPRQMVIMENVRVLNVGPLVRETADEGRGGRGFRSIGIDLDPADQVAFLQVRDLVMQFGGFQITLRAPGDDQRTWTPSRTTNPPIPNINPEVVRLMESLMGGQPLYPDTGRGRR